MLAKVFSVYHLIVGSRYNCTFIYARYILITLHKYLTKGETNERENNIHTIIYYIIIIICIYYYYMYMYSSINIYYVIILFYCIEREREMYVIKFKS